MKKQKKPTEKELREIADEHRCLSEVIERLLDAGWLDSERVADMIATELIEDPYCIREKKLENMSVKTRKRKNPQKSEEEETGFGYSDWDYFVDNIFE